MDIAKFHQVATLKNAFYARKYCKMKLKRRKNDYSTGVQKRKF
jgi:hypothetical protein